MNSALMFSKASDLWTTPRELFAELDAEFHFELDAAATRETALGGEYFGPDHEVPEYRDALALQQWGKPYRPLTIWLNPPYSKCRQFIAKASEQAVHGNTVVCLVPARTDTRWFHEYVWDARFSQPRRYVEVRFLKGRLKFGNSQNSAPFPSVVIVFRGAA